MLYHSFQAMNTGILLAAEGDRNRLTLAFHDVERLVKRYEQRFSRFLETSELSALNRATGRWFGASAALYEIVRLAIQAYQSTGGLFNPGILKALEQAGYDRSMDELGQRGAAPPAEQPPFRSAPPFDQVRLDESRRAIWLPQGMRIDLGGIAKGWIAGQAAEQLRCSAGACAVDAGGDLAICGLPEGEQAWPVALDDPLQPDHDLAVLFVSPGAVATSSVMKRRWEQGGRARHHLIDPRTGQPASAAWASVTVVIEENQADQKDLAGREGRLGQENLEHFPPRLAGSGGVVAEPGLSRVAQAAAQAEVLAKALLIAGPAGADELAQSHPEAAFITVDFHGKIWGSQNSGELIYGNAR